MKCSPGDVRIPRTATASSPIRLLSATLGALLLGGCPAQTQTFVNVPPTLPVVDELTLGPGDTFDVRVFGEPELTGTYRVDPDGTITYPLVGSIKVEGLQARAAAELLASKLSQQFLRHPQVSIFVRDQPSKKITVFGLVVKPGGYPFVQGMTVVDAITAAGGFTPLAKKNNVTITCSINGRESKMEHVPVQDISEGKASNVPLQPGCIVSVLESII